MFSRDKYLPSRSRIAALVGLAALVAVDALANEPLSPLDNPEVVAALRTVWFQTINGRRGTEASFRLDGKPSAYRIITSPPTNEFRKQKLEIIPGLTLAVFHVHTAKGEPEPSPADRSIADRYKLRMYTIHLQGLYEYDPVTKRTTKLRDGVKWMNRGIQEVY